jgi:hypothetical protein
MGGAGRIDSADPKVATAAFAEVQRQFIRNGEFTAGLATHYPPGLLTGDDTHLHPAPGYPPERRFKSAEVIRLGEPSASTSGTCTAPTAGGGSTPLLMPSIPASVGRGSLT